MEQVEASSFPIIFDTVEFFSKHPLLTGLWKYSTRAKSANNDKAANRILSFKRKSI